MGNQLSSYPHKQDDNDQDYLNFQASALFNDSFVCSVEEKLPDYGYPKPKEGFAPSNETDGIWKTVLEEQSMEIDKVLSIFAPTNEKQIKVEDFKELSAADVLSKSAFTILSQKRQKILMRIFQAYKSSLLEEHGAKGGSGTKRRYWQLQSNATDEKADDNVVFALSIGMSVALAKVLGSSNAAVLVAILGSTIDILKTLTPLALSAASKSQGLSKVVESLNSLCADCLVSSDETVRNLAISVQLLVGLLSGSVSSLISIADKLSNSPNLSLHEAVVALLKQYVKIRPNFDLSFPSNRFTSDKISVGLGLKDEQLSKIKKSPALLSIVCDGTFIYLFNGVSKTIQKLGTGFNGTVPGELISTCSLPLSSLPKSESEGAAESEEEILGKATLYKNKLFVKVESKSFKNLILVFDTLNMKFDRCIDIDALLAKGGDLQNREQVKQVADTVHSYELEKHKQLCLVGSRGTTLTVTSAMVNDIDCTDEIRSCLNASNTTLVHDSLPELLQEKAPQAANNGTLTINLRSETVLDEGQTPCLSIVSENNGILSIFESGKRTVESSRQVFDLYQQVQIISAVITGSDDEENKTITDEVTACFNSFVVKYLHGDADESVFKSDWKQLVKSSENEEHPDSDSEDSEHESDEDSEKKSAKVKLVINFSLFEDLKGSFTMAHDCNWKKMFESMQKSIGTESFDYFGVVFDPDNEESGVKKVTFKQPQHKTTEHNDFRRGDIYSNGHRMVVISSDVMEEKDELKVQVKARKFSCYDSREYLDSFNVVFTKSIGLPVAFAYDSSNNMIWGLDFNSSTILRWRNRGNPVPQVDANDAHETNQLSKSPTERLDALVRNNQYSSELSTVLFTLLEKLSEPYGVFNPYVSLAENEVQHAIKLTATSSTKSKCSIVVAGIPVSFDDDEEEESFGFHLAVLSESFEVIKTRLFDNENDEYATERMTDFIDQLPNGSIVLLANVNCLHDAMTKSSYEALTKLGAIDLSQFENERSFLLIGRKGLAPGEAEFALGKGEEKIQLRRLLPLVSTPLAVEPNPLTVKLLIETLVSKSKNISDSSAERDIMHFTSVLRIAQSHIQFYVNRGDESDLLKSISQQTINELKDMLMKLTRGGLMRYPYLRHGTIALLLSSLHILCPTKLDVTALLRSYVKKYNENIATTTEIALFEVLLRKCTDASFILDSTGKFEFAEELLDLSSAIVRKEIELSFGAAKTSGQFVSKTSKIVESAVAVILSVSKVFLAVESNRASTEATSTSSQQNQQVNLAFSVASQMSRLSSQIISIAAEVLQSTSVENKDEFAGQLLQAIQSTPVGSVLPFAAVTVTTLLQRCGYNFLSHSLESVLPLIKDLVECLEKIENFLPLLPEEAQLYVDSIPTPDSSSKVFESEHNYRSNMNEYTTISFPGAISVTITFDPASRTEHECDYVQFMDMANNLLHDGKYSGRDGNQNWPGTDGRPPLVLDKNEFKLFFHSDGSVEDWGYKFTATAKYPPKQEVQNRSNWLLRLSLELVQALSCVGTLLVQGPPKKVELEGKYSSFMENSIVKPELFLYYDYGQNEENDFLVDLINPSGKPTAENLLKVMKKHVPEDQGTIEAVNKAVYATCAAIIKVNGLAKEAIAVAKGSRRDVSSQLIKAWKNGQKMRSFFDFKDVRASVTIGDAGESIAGPSLYSGADDGVIEAASKAIVERAKFLLRTPATSGVEPESLLTQSDDGDDNIQPVSPQRSGSENLAGNSSISPFALGPPESPEKGSGLSNWRLAAKAISLKRQYSDDTRNVAKMWHSLVDEAVVVDKLKNVLVHRRKFAERSRAGKQLTLTERVLQFVQSDVEIDKLQKLNSLRNKRTIARSKGLDLFAQLLKHCSSPFAIYIASSYVVDAFAKTKKEEGSDAGLVHYGNALEGCSPEQNAVLCHTYAGFLKTVVEVVQRCSNSLDQKKQSKQWTAALDAALCACILDYEYSDGNILAESGIVPLTDNLLQSSQLPSATKQKVMRLVEILSVHFLAFNPNGDGKAEPHKISKELIQLITNILQKSYSSEPSTNAAGEQSDSSVTALNDVPHITIADQAIELSRGKDSLVYPSTAVTLEHSICFAFKRSSSALLDRPITEETMLGMTVMRGKAWVEDAKRADGGIGNIGVITSTKKEGEAYKVKVKWLSGKDYMYDMAINENISSGEVVLADPFIAGYILEQGNMEIKPAKKRTIPIVSGFSAQVLPDASLLATYNLSNGEKIYLRTSKPLPADTWSNIAITCDATYQIKLFVNGELQETSQFTLPAFWEGESIIESAHPISSQDDEEKTIAIEKAARLMVSFDEQSMLGKSSSLRLCESDNNEMCSIITEENASERPQAFPGTAGFPVRTSSTAELKLHFQQNQESRAENSEWGYKIAVRGLSEAISKEMQDIATDLPYYLGHAPTFAASATSALNQCASGVVAKVRLFSSALDKTRLQELHEMQEKDGYGSAEFIREDSALNAFGILRKAVENLDRLCDSGMKRAFASSGIVSIVFDLMVRGSNTIQTAAYHVAASTFPILDIELVDYNARKSGFITAQNETFLESLIGQIGKAYNFWARRWALRLRDGDLLQPANEDQLSVLVGQVKLLRAICAQGTMEWQSLGKEHINRLISEVTTLVSQCSVLAAEEMKKATHDLKPGEFVARSNQDDKEVIAQLQRSDPVFGVLAWLGYDVCNIYPGAVVQYTDEKSGISEFATVLKVANPPLDIEEMKKKEKPSAVDTSPKNYGDYLAIVLWSQPSESMVVSRQQVRFQSDEAKVDQQFADFLLKQVKVEHLAELFNKISEISVVDSRAKPQPIIEESEQTLHFESEHNYADNLDVYEDISIPGASELKITFDPQCRLETNCDYIQFYKNSSRTETFGTRYTGRDGSQNFPGYENRDPLVIPASSCVMHFHTDSSGNDWGYKFQVYGKIVKVTEPPALPVLPHFSQAAQIKMMGMKTLRAALTTISPLISHTLPSITSVVKSALSPAPQSLVKGVEGSGKQELMFESRHPYEDGLDVYIPVSVPGATSFSITFDPETRTESNCDYMILYTDDSHSTKVEGSETYTGGKDGSSSNWPGLQDRPPFTFQGNSFVIYFHSDGSVNDWGWRMYVTAYLGNSVMGPTKQVIRGAKLNAANAELCCSYLQSVALDGLKNDSRSKKSKSFKNFTFQKAAVASPYTVDLSQLNIGDDASNKQEETALITSVSRVNIESDVLLNVEASQVIIYESPSTDATEIERLSKGAPIILAKDDNIRGDWLRVVKIDISKSSEESGESASEEKKEVFGWIQLRGSDNQLNVSVAKNDRYVEEVGAISASPADEKAKQAAEEKKKKELSKYRNPMYLPEDVDESTTKNKLQLEAPAPHPNTILQQDYDNIEIAISEYSMIASIRYSAECLSAMIKTWPEEISLDQSHFGGVDNLLTYVNSLVSAAVDSESLVITPSQDLQRLVDLVVKQSGKGSAVISALVSFATGYLETEVHAKDVVSKEQKFYRRGMKKTIESKHPYDHNMDENTIVRFPGAKKIEILFDPRSCTETNYDYLTIFDANRENQLYPNKIHGYLTASDRHWPGVNVPKIVLETDAICFNFKSDGGTNDWGYIAHCYGIMEEPEASSSASTAKKENTDSATRPDYSMLACWILYNFSSAASQLSSATKHLVFNPQCFQALVDYFNSGKSSKYSVWLINIFVAFMQEWSDKTGNSMAEFWDILLHLERSCIHFANELWKTETNSGENTTKVSPLLQSVVQLLISINTAIDHVKLAGGNSSSSSSASAAADTESNIMRTSALLPSETIKLEDGSGVKYFFGDLPEKKGAVLAWDVKISKTTSSKDITIGLSQRSSRRFELGWRQNELLLRTPERSQVLPYGADVKTWSAGDVIHVEFDRNKGSLFFAINGFPLPVAVADATKLPVIEADLKELDFDLFVQVKEPGDSFVQVSLSEKLMVSTDTTMGQGSNLVQWLNPLYDLNSFLRAFSTKQLPGLVIKNNLMPYCIKALTIPLDLSGSHLQSHAGVFERDLFIEGAESTNISFVSLVLEDGEQLEIIDTANDAVKLSVKGPFTFQGSASFEQLLHQMSNLDDRSRRLDKLYPAFACKTPKVGDTVARGPNWQYLSQDGGLGSTGVVSKYDPNSEFGLLVRWSNGFEGAYRFNSSQNIYDVVVENKVDNSLEAPAIRPDGWWGSAAQRLKLRLLTSTPPSSSADTSEGENTAAEKKSELKAFVYPALSVNLCLQDERFETYRNHLYSLFVVSNKEMLNALAKHIDSRTKESDAESVFARKWSDFEPSEVELSRSPQLKELNQLTPEEITANDLKILAVHSILSSGGAISTAAITAAANSLFLDSNSAPAAEDETPGLRLSKPHEGFSLATKVEWCGINDFSSLEEATAAAKDIYPECKGITRETNGVFSLRGGSDLIASAGETSWQLYMYEGKSAATATEETLSAELLGLIAADDINGEENDSMVEGSDGDGLEDDEHEEEDENEDEEEHEDEEEDEEEMWETDSSSDLEEHLNRSTSRSVSRSRSRSRSRSPPVLARQTSSGSRRQARQAASTSSAVHPVCGKCHKKMRKHPAGTWHNGWSCDWPTHQGPNTFRGDDPVWGCDTIISCNWGACATCWKKIAPKTDENIAQQLLNSTNNTKPIASQFSLLIFFNMTLNKVLPYIDLKVASKAPAGTLAAMLSANRDLVLEVVKKEIFEQWLTNSAVSGGQFPLTLNRVKAKRLANAGKVDLEGRWSVFAQAFRTMHAMNPSGFRRADRLYTTKFLGEHAQDAGGPYRESFDNYAQELQSAALPLLIRTPNGRQAVGYNRDKWILNPSATTKIQLEMFSFLGKLMGIAIRSKEFLPLNIPSIIWKLIAGQRPSLDDLEAVDFSFVKSIELLRDIESTGVTAETFSTIFFETFTTNSSDDKVVELIPAGKDKEVTFENRLHYCDLVLRYRLHEFDRQAEAIRAGLGTVIPLSLLTLYSWEQLERMVCGSPEIDIKLLQSITEYSGCSSTDEHVVLFWRALEDFNNEERSALIRFTWGRSRLPLNAASFTQRFKLQNFDKRPPDQYFPVAHTCFFSLELPRYSSLEIMKEKLRYAIFNCEAIDGDDTATGIAAAAMGWEEDEDTDET